MATLTREIGRKPEEKETTLDEAAIWVVNLFDQANTGGAPDLLWHHSAYTKTLSEILFKIL